MTRSAVEFWCGVKPPKDVAYYYFDHNGKTAVTYKELLHDKIEKQHERLRYKLKYGKSVPGFIWVFYNDSWCYGGWWIYIKTLHEDYKLNFKGVRTEMVEKIMGYFPYTLFNKYEYFSQWAEEFVKEFSHVGFRRKKKQGITPCWCCIDENGKLIDIFIQK